MVTCDGWFNWFTLVGLCCVLICFVVFGWLGYLLACFCWYFGLLGFDLLWLVILLTDCWFDYVGVALLLICGLVFAG